MITSPKASSQSQTGPTGPGSAATDTYTLQFTTPPLVNGQTADGKTPDKGQVVATQDGHRLDDPKIVLFTFVGPTSAQFLYETTPNVQPNSTSTMLMVMTDYNAEAGGDIAQAWFTDTAADNPVTVSAILQVPGAPSDSQKFNFTGNAQHVYDLEFNPPLANNQTTGGGIDQGQAYVTEDGGRLGTDQTVLFTFDTGSAQFILTGDSNIQPKSDSTHLYVTTHYDDGLQQDIANASFTDTVADNPVTLRAALVDHTEAPSRTQDFAFTVYALTFLTPPLADNQWADGNAKNAVRAIVTKNGKAFTNADQPVPVTFTSSSTTTEFDMNQPNVQNGSTSAKLIVLTSNDQQSGYTSADAWFTDSTPEQVTITGALEAYNVSNTQTLTFSLGYQIALKPIHDGAPGDGSTPNQGRAFVTYGGLPLTENTVVQFQIFNPNSYHARLLTTDPNITYADADDGWINVQTHIENNQCFADVWFIDSNSGGETVPLEVTFLERPGINTTYDFTFTASKDA